ncbi:hypothetical protein B5X24_HaOG209942 [Helicoverpa armigera]|uniref:Uncharacterized protein n=1 Tax=Helicoverpa armigera TaxID=29058 RepID=A0A2W1BFW7_HELAM|nr:hypothetical protein B5X24_HaOG209942 [Helicoverpa armigera]
MSKVDRSVVLFILVLFVLVTEEGRMGDAIMQTGVVIMWDNHDTFSLYGVKVALDCGSPGKCGTFDDANDSNH